jgi:hypothetical protein
MKNELLYKIPNLSPDTFRALEDAVMLAYKDFLTFSNTVTYSPDSVGAVVENVQQHVMNFAASVKTATQDGSTAPLLIVTSILEKILIGYSQLSIMQRMSDYES